MAEENAQITLQNQNTDHVENLDGSTPTALQANITEAGASSANRLEPGDAQPNGVNNAPQTQEPDSLNPVGVLDGDLPTAQGSEESSFQEQTQETEVDASQDPSIPEKEDLLETPAAISTIPVVLFPTSEEHGGRHISSRSSTTTVPSNRRSLTISSGTNVSVVLIVSALETIAASKEAKRSAPLRESTQCALKLIRSNLAGDRPRDILEPLRLACETRNEKLMIASLDCISKLISYSFFTEDDIYVTHEIQSPPPSPHSNGRNSTGRASQNSVPQPSIVDLVVHTITACHTETTSEAVSLQIVKALLALVLSPSVFVHHSSLLKTVRTVYNVFLLSSDPVNQMVAQGGLTQMVHHVFTRCNMNRIKASEDSPTASYGAQSFVTSSRTSIHAGPSEDILKLNSQSLGLEMSEEQEDSLPQLPSLQEENPSQASVRTVSSFLKSPLITFHRVETSTSGQIDSPIGNRLTQRDLFVKDAYLVFRTLCKLTMKPLNQERSVNPVLL